MDGRDLSCDVQMERMMCDDEWLDSSPSRGGGEERRGPFWRASESSIYIANSHYLISPVVVLKVH